MENINSFQNLLNKINKSNFDNHALNLFKYQARFNKVYRSYLGLLSTEPSDVKKLQEIPFLPIEFFKYHSVTTNEWPPEIVFESSGTTSSDRSHHHIKDLDFYLNNATELFERTFGKLVDMHIVALLPTYNQRQVSSLVSMVNHFIQQADPSISGFYPDDNDQLIKFLTQNREQEKIYLFGVTFALLDFAEKYELDLSHITVIETGGMKGRREEITKEELYAILAKRLNIKSIYSEYGMTELLSQAYGRDGMFVQPPSMKVLIREINDPSTLQVNSRIGGINIIDLANVHSCAFIETKDLGRINEDGTFEVLGRFDNADLRGCNLLVD